MHVRSSREAAEKPPGQQTLRVLVVDEDPLTREATTRRLARAGYQVVGAGSAPDSAEAPVDLVVVSSCADGRQSDVAQIVQAALDRSPAGDEVLAGPLRLILLSRSRRAFVYERAVFLTPKGFDVLRVLLERRGEVLSPDELSLAIWGYGTFGSPNFVEAQISRVRSALAQVGMSDVIETVRGAGYVVR